MAQIVHEVPHRRAAYVLKQGGTQAKDRHDKGPLAEGNPQNTPNVDVHQCHWSWVQETRCPGLLQTSKIKIARKDSKQQDLKSATVMRVMSQTVTFYLTGPGGLAFIA